MQMHRAWHASTTQRTPLCIWHMLHTFIEAEHTPTKTHFPASDNPVDSRRRHNLFISSQLASTSIGVNLARETIRSVDYSQSHLVVGCVNVAWFFSSAFSFSVSSRPSLKSETNKYILYIIRMYPRLISSRPKKGNRSFCVCSRRFSWKKTMINQCSRPQAMMSELNRKTSVVSDSACSEFWACILCVLIDVAKVITNGVIIEVWLCKFPETWKPVWPSGLLNVGI